MASHEQHYRDESKGMADAVKEKGREAKEWAGQKGEEAHDKSREAAEATKEKAVEGKEKTKGVLQQTGERVKQMAEGAADTVKQTLGVGQQHHPGDQTRHTGEETIDPTAGTRGVNH